MAFDLEKIKKEWQSFYNCYTGNDDFLVESAAPYFMPGSFIVLGLAHGYANTWLHTQGYTLLNQVLSNPSSNTKIKLILSICSFQALNSGVSYVIDRHFAALSNTLDKSSIKVAKGAIGAICELKAINYLASIKDTIESHLIGTYKIGMFISTGYEAINSISYTNSSNRYAVILLQCLKLANSLCSMYIEYETSQKKKLIETIEANIKFLQDKSQSAQLVSINEQFLKKQLDSLTAAKQNAQKSLENFTIFTSFEKIVSSAYYLFSSISMLEGLEKSDIQYSKTLFDIQAFISEIFKNQSVTQNASPNQDNVLFANINAANIKAKTEFTETAFNDNTYYGVYAYFSQFITDPGEAPYQKNVWIHYDFTNSPQSILITGANGLGKSVILRALAGSLIYAFEENKPSSRVGYRDGFKKEDIVYIMQGDLTALTNITIYKSLTDSNMIGTLIERAKEKVQGLFGHHTEMKEPARPDNIAGITPYDIFTAFLSEEQKNDAETKAKIEQECARLIDALKLDLQFKKSDGIIDLHKCIEIKDASGGQEQKIKFIMMAVTALYGGKKLILIDELYNHLSQESSDVMTTEFKALMNRTQDVKYISTDHRPDAAQRDIYQQKGAPQLQISQ